MNLGTQMSAKRPRVALVDNDGPEPGLHLLEAEAEVFIFRDALVAEAEIPGLALDLVVTDLLMPGINGSDLLQSLLDKGVSSKFTVRSGYFDTSEVSNLSFFSRNRVGLSDKHEVSSKSFYETLIKNLRTGTQINDENLSSQLNVEKQRSALDLSYEEFRQLPQEDRFLLVESARKTLSSEIEDAFSSGAVWYLFGGRGASPLIATNYGDLPSRQEIRSFCQTRNIPVIQYFRGVEIDDLFLSWKDTCADSMKNYPILGLSGSGKKEDVLAVHFDTGSPACFADFDVLSHLSDDIEPRDQIDFVPFEVNGVSIPVTHDKLKLWLIDPLGNSPRVIVTFVVPRNWRDLPISHRLCGSACRRSGNEKAATALNGYGQHERSGELAYFCRYRWGLIGRSFLIETGLSLVVNGKDRVVHLYQEGK